MGLSIRRPGTPSQTGASTQAALRILVVATILASLFTFLPGGRFALALDQQYTLTNLSNQSLSAETGATFSENLGVRVCRVMTFPCQPLNGINVTFTATTSEGGASGTFSTTGTNSVTVQSVNVPYQGVPAGVDGIANAPSFTANGTAGSYQVKAVAAEPDPTKAVPYFFFMTNTSNAANLAFQISDAGGSLQATLVNTTYQDSFYAAVYDGNNQLKSGVTVTFTAPNSGPSGTFTTTGTTVATAVTGNTGLAAAPPFQANALQGSYSVTASVSGDQTTSGEEITTAYSLRNSTTNVLGVPETVSASAGNGQQISVLSTYPVNLAVAVFDGSLDYVSGASVTFTLPSTGASGLFSNNSLTYTTTTNNTGVATALPITTNATVGQITVDATATKGGVSKSTNIGLINGRVLTTTSLAIAPNITAVYGQPVVLSATVRPVEGSLVPAGPVDFSESGTVIDICDDVTPVNGVATCTLTWLEPGVYSYKADYLGDVYSQESTSLTVGHTVIKADTSIALQSSKPTFVLHGEDVTFTATVSPVAPGAAQPGEPTGTIVFTSSDGTVLNGGNGVTLVNGVASVTTSDLEIGDPTITATYAGDGHFFGSTNTLLQHVYTIPVVTEDPTSTLKLVGETVTFTAGATGYPTPTLVWQVSTDDGQSFTDIVGQTATTYSFTAARSDDGKQYRAVFTNAAGSDTTADAVLTVRQPPFFTSPDSATFTVGASGTFTVVADGHLAPTLSLTGNLPDGVSFVAGTGVLSGTPALGSGGVYTLTVTATNSVDPDATQTFTLTVEEAPTFTSDDATTFIVGTADSFSFATSDHPNATFTTADTLPSGVTLGSDGVLAGTAAVGTFGVYALEILAVNGISPDATQTFTLTVHEAASFTSTDNATFTVGVDGTTLTVAASGLPVPTLSVVGDLPDGMSFDDTTGVLSGTPIDGSGGMHTLTFSATNGIGVDATQTFTLTVAEAPAFTSASAATCVIGAACGFTMQVSGYPGATFATTDLLPTGVILGSNGVFAGIPAVGMSGAYVLDVVAGNGVQTDATQTFTLTIEIPDTIAPVATKPTLALGTGPAQLGTVPVVATWTGFDAIGVVGYHVQLKRDSGAWVGQYVIPGAVTKTLQLPADSTYRVRVRGVDAVGNLGVWSYSRLLSTTLVEEDDASVTYTGRWWTGSVASSSNGQSMKSFAANATATVEFQGTSIAWIAALDATRGLAEVYINGDYIETVDLYRANASGAMSVFSHSGLSRTGTHTLTVKVLGQGQLLSSGTAIVIDSFIIGQ